MNDAVAGGLLWPELLEGAMLICFGLSWPVAIVKTLRMRRTEGKSFGFILLVLAGYLLGIAAKAAHAAAGHEPLPPVTWLYVANSLAVAADAVLFLHYRRHPGGRPALSLADSP